MPRADLSIVLGRDKNSRKLLVYQLPDHLGVTQPGYRWRDRLVYEVKELPPHARDHLEDMVKASATGLFDFVMNDTVVHLDAEADSRHPQR